MVNYVLKTWKHRRIANGSLLSGTHCVRLAAPKGVGGWLIAISKGGRKKCVTSKCPQQQTLTAGKLEMELTALPLGMKGERSRPTGVISDVCVYVCEREKN